MGVIHYFPNLTYFIGVNCYYLNVYFYNILKRHGIKIELEERTKNLKFYYVFLFENNN